MSFRQTFRINTPAVVSEIFDDEIVIIHLESGAYYSLDQSGADIWKLLQQGADLAEINTRLSAAYSVSPDEMAQIVPQFVKELTQEQLIIPTPTSPQPLHGSTDKMTLHPAPSNQPRFAPPFYKNIPICKSYCCSTLFMKSMTAVGRGKGGTTATEDEETKYILTASVAQPLVAGGSVLPVGREPCR
jgi:hypothetical protein